MYLTKEQINKFIEKIGQPEASILLNKFFNSYKNHLSSDDVSNLYDSIYFEKIREHKIAKIVDNTFLINIYNYPSYEYIINSAKSGSILDIGCGFGDFLLALATKGFNGIGVDYNKASIQEANEKALKAKLPVKFMCKDASTLSESTLFDFIVMNDVTEHVSDKELILILKTIKKLLKPTGKFLIHTPNGLALCHETDTSFLQIIYKSYLTIFKGYKGFKREKDQLFYDQVHINVKSYKQLKKILNLCDFQSKVNYEIDPAFYKIKSLNSIFKSVLSSNMLIIAYHK